MRNLSLSFIHRPAPLFLPPPLPYLFAHLISSSMPPPPPHSVPPFPCRSRFSPSSPFLMTLRSISPRVHLLTYSPPRSPLSLVAEYKSYFFFFFSYIPCLPLLTENVNHCAHTSTEAHLLIPQHEPKAVALPMRSRRTRV